MEIKVNILLDDLIEIFDGNNQSFVCDKNCIKNDEFLKIVAVIDGVAVGYAVLYQGNDFLEREGFPFKANIKGENIYVWHCITRNGFENKGVQTEIYNYFTNKFKDCDIYSVVDEVNIPSIKLHNKFNFKVVGTFEKFYSNKLCKFNLLKRDKL